MIIDSRRGAIGSSLFRGSRGPTYVSFEVRCSGRQGSDIRMAWGPGMTRTLVRNVNVSVDEDQVGGLWRRAKYYLSLV